MTTKEDILKVKELIDKVPLAWRSAGLTAELADEGDPEGLVLIRNAQGAVVMSMPHEDYEAIKGHKP